MLRIKQNQSRLLSRDLPKIKALLPYLITKYQISLKNFKLLGNVPNIIYQASNYKHVLSGSSGANIFGDV